MTTFVKLTRTVRNVTAAALAVAVIAVGCASEQSTIPGAAPEPEPELSTGAASEPEPELSTTAASEPEPELSTTAASEPEPELSTGAASEPEPELSTTAASEPEPELSTTAASEPEPELSTTAASEPEPELSTTAASEPEPELSTTAASEPEPELSTTAASEPEPEPAPTTAAPEPEPEPEPVPTHWGTVASIYNDNVFVLPVSEDLSSVVDLPLRDYAGFFYENFEDEFDFLIFVRNLVRGAEGVVRNISHHYAAVSNEVRGIGKPIFSDATSWGSSGRLQGSVFLTWVEFADLVRRQEWRLFRSGPILHELMHRWANSVLPTAYDAHWGFSSAAGVVGGFDITDLADRGGGQYTAGSWSVAGPNKPPNFSSIELYLAGFIPPEEVPDLWVAEDGEFLYDEGRRVWTDNGPVFTAQFSVYTIEDLIAEHGPRIPNASQSQKDFRAAVILLTDEKHAADPQVLKKLSDDVSWFSHAGVSGTDDRYLGTDLYNFYEATGGRGTITIDGLSEFRRQ